MMNTQIDSKHMSAKMWCHHFGKTPEEANKRAARQLLPVPVFRLGSPRSLHGWSLLTCWLPTLDGQRDQATKKWQKLQRA